MLDNLINLDAPTLLESATEHHWAEMHKHGETTFHSDDEMRVISKDECMREVLDRIKDDGLYNRISELSCGFLMDLVEMAECELKSEMTEALNDYYN